MPIEQGSEPQGISALYYHIARYPELGLFRCFAPYWAKKVHDDTSVFLESLRKVNEELGKIEGFEGKSILDCPLVVMKKKCPVGRFGPLYDAWTKYEENLERHGEVVCPISDAFQTDCRLGRTLCMSEQIMKLPHQHAFYTEYLAKFKPPHTADIFENDVFVPTGEDADRYQNSPERNDTCAWRSMPQTDFLTTCFYYCSRWIEVYIPVRLRSCITGRKGSKEGMAKVDAQLDVRHDRIVSFMDTFSCLIASILLWIPVQVLASVRPQKTRIATVGVFGTLFALSVKLMAGDIKRGEVFGATAAFYAVAVVFVSSTRDDCACR
jgi:hypothetical protein